MRGERESEKRGEKRERERERGIEREREGDRERRLGTGTAGGTSPARWSLRQSVCSAFAWRNPSLGYTVRIFI